MPIYNMYLYDRNGQCVYYAEWLRLKPTPVNKDEGAKLLYGMVLSLKSFVSKLSPVADSRANFKSFLTSTYKATLFETATGMRIIMTTDRSAAGIYELLRQVYAEAVVPYVMKTGQLKDGQLRSKIFENQVHDLVQKHPSFYNQSANKP